EDLRFETRPAYADGQNLAGVAHLRQRLLADEGADLDAIETGGDEPLQQPDFRLSGNKGVDTLVAVAGTDLDDLDLATLRHDTTPRSRNLLISSALRPRSSRKISSVWAPIGGPVQRIAPGSSGTWGTIPACKTLPNSGSSTSRTMPRMRSCLSAAISTAV